MALFSAGPAVGSISGSVGGMTFSHNQGGAYIRRRAIPTNPNTPAQTAIRSATNQNSQAWQGLTLNQRDSWNAFASSVSLASYRNALGLAGQLSGQQAYVRLNNRLRYAGLSVINTPPAGDAAPSVPADILSPDFAVIVGGTGLTLGLGLSSLAAGLRYQAMVAGPYGPGRTRVQERDHRLVYTSTDTAYDETDAGAAYVDRYGVPPVGSQLSVGVRVIEIATGAISPVVVTGLVAVTSA